MRTHPELFLPEAKEQLFFNRDEAYAEGWEAFSRTAFYGAEPNRKLGMITPHYLGGPVLLGDSTAGGSRADGHVITARRIANDFPDVKLIVMLRDPTERAISSYWQGVVLGDERRQMDVAFAEDLSEGGLARARATPTNDHIHVVAGEYGRLLGDYLDFFPRSQIFIGSTSDLAEEPIEFMRSMWRFLGVSESHVPGNLGQRYNQRGTSRRSHLIGAVSGTMRRNRGLRRAWMATPVSLRSKLRHRLRTIDHRRDQKTKAEIPVLDEAPDPGLVVRLREHYEPDIAKLRELVGHVPGVTDSTNGMRVSGDHAQIGRALRH